MSKLTEQERERIRYAAGHLIGGEQDIESPMPSGHGTDSIDLAWDEFEEIVAAREKAAAERIAQAIEHDYAEWDCGQGPYPMYSEGWLVTRVYERAARIARGGGGAE